MITTKSKTSFSQKIHLFLNLLFLYLSALGNPRIVYPLIIARALFLITTVSTSALLRLNYNIKVFMYKNFSYAILSIFLFSLFFFYTSYTYQFITEAELLLGLTLPSLSYLVGYSINFLKLPDKPFNFIYAAIALIGGGITVVYLSVINNPVAAVGAGIDIASRRVASIWGAEFVINGPAIDLYSMLGISLLPLIINGKSKQVNIKIYGIVSIASFIFFAMGIYSSLALQGRKPIFYLCFLFLVCLFWIFFTTKQISNKFWYIICVTVLMIVVFAFYETTFMYLTDNFGVFRRIESDGADTPRYLVWLEVLQGIPEILFGGRSFKISANYAHNLWLDVLYDAGLLPLIFILIFHYLHLKAIIKICFSQLPDILIICVISIVIALLFGWQAEPAIQSSIYYFSMTCSLLGLIMRLSHAADSYTKFEAKT